MENLHLIGRQTECAQLDYLMQSGKAEFIAVYGRRRVGKTYLLTEHLGERINFYTSGVLNGKPVQQKEAFVHSLEKIGQSASTADTWLTLFSQLEKALQPRLDAGLLTVIFIDEIPCFDTQRSEFIAALDHFWNTWASHYNNMKFIVCGSATSWIISNIVDSHGGLHNRLTFSIHLHPFTLAETEQYFKMRKIAWSRKMLLQAYMAFGGIPFYLSLIMPQESLSQTLDRLYCDADGILHAEYDRLMASLFKAPKVYQDIIMVLASKKQGMTRNEIADRLGSNTGGGLSKALTDLENCDFIRRYYVRAKKIKSNSAIYALTDMFTLFHFYFKDKTHDDKHFFTKHLNEPLVNTWNGLAFERVVMHHINQVQQALGIGGISVEFYQWRSTASTPAAQIDLILDRADGIINICEMKFAPQQYLLSKDEFDKLQNRIWAFQNETGTKKGIHLTMITPYGIQPNTYSYEVQREVKLDDLFAPTRN